MSFTQKKDVLEFTFLLTLRVNSSFSRVKGSKGVERYVFPCIFVSFVSVANFWQRKKSLINDTENEQKMHLFIAANNLTRFNCFSNLSPFALDPPFLRGSFFSQYFRKIHIKPILGPFYFHLGPFISNIYCSNYWPHLQLFSAF